ncbi:hypothetical protein BJ322DRAFT_1114555 [Thelephora terrestris]|uniref:Uncharacterized protein n=1 Tax=Thelephora terrestris TaxID=56493 RepID=A0A9P6L146_9AGAM|nr:hypothetical protein BJ322DRAFT_1114555 [Thelephora terrestris]
MPRASTRNPTRRSSSYSPVQENNYNIDRFSHARHDPSRPYPTLGAVMDRTATADPNEGFSDLGFRDFLQAARRVSRRKLARIETNPYANELLNRGVEFVTEANETFNSVLEASVLHTGNVGSMLMDEVAHVNERIDGRHEEIEALENWKEDMQGVIHGQEDSVVRQGADIDLLKGEVTTLKDLVRALVTKTGELEDDKVCLTRRVSELTGEVWDLQRRCNESEVRVEEEEEEEVLHRAGLVPVDDEVIEIGSDEFYQNVGVVRRDTPRPEFVSTPWGSRRQWPALEYDPYAEFVPDSEPNSDTELPDYDDLSDVDPNKIREQNWVNEELKGVNGEIITVCNTRVEESLNRKTKPRYLGPMVVVCKTKGTSYIVAELDGAQSQLCVAGFRLIPYFPHTATNIPLVSDLDDDEDFTWDDPEDVRYLSSLPDDHSYVSLSPPSL